MPKLRRDVQPLLQRAIESLTISIELFNRPAETARSHAVPILLHHAFELLLKATILQAGRAIHDKTSRYTFGFDRCLVITEEELGLISRDERATLSILDAHRDTAAHFYAEISEDVLYVLAQSSVTLFNRLVGEAFKQSLADHMPTRVLPVSARPPRDLFVLLTSELAEVDELLKAGTRRGAQAAAKLRSILAFATATRDKAQRVAESELKSFDAGEDRYHLRRYSGATRQYGMEQGKRGHAHAWRSGPGCGTTEREQREAQPGTQAQRAGDGMRARAGEQQCGTNAEKCRGRRAGSSGLEGERTAESQKGKVSESLSDIRSRSGWSWMPRVMGARARYWAREM